MLLQIGRWLDRNLLRLEAAILVITLVSSVVSLVIDILLRNLAGMALPWAAELTRYAIVWMVFIGGSLAARSGAHISIDVLGEVLPARLGRALGAAAMVASAAGCGALAVVGWQLVQQMLAFRQISPSLEIPMWWVYLALPVGFALMTVRFLQAAVEAGLREPVAGAEPSRPAAAG